MRPKEDQSNKKKGGFMTMQKRIRSSVFILLLCLSYGSLALADRCTDLATATPLVPYGGAVITGATMVPASATLPAYCMVTATVGKNTDTDPQMDIEVWLPETWHKRLLHIGGGGFDGVMGIENAMANPVFRSNYVEKPLQNGFALAASNGGHRGANSIDSTFLALFDYSMTQDYAHTAIGTTVRVAKALIAGYYGERPKYSYFWGCSNGGRGAFNAAAKYAHEYDGVMAFAPSRNMPGLSSAWTEFTPAAILAPGKIATIKNASLVACDRLDGINDGIISNPDACTFDPAGLLCRGTSNDSCLTDAELAIVKKIQSDLRLQDGTLVYSRTGFGELNWAWGYGFLGPGYVNLMTFQDPDYSDWELNKDYPKLVQVLDGAYGCSGETDALARYLNEGRKMIVFHGTDDTLLSHYDTARTFYEVTDAANPRGRQDAKLYMAAGVGHCVGGPGADTFDLITPMTQWVEMGKEPKDVLASKLDGAGNVLFTRPLCEHPRYPHYKSGNPDDAASFTCKLLSHGKGAR
jgi:feruloyl esterase